MSGQTHIRRYLLSGLLTLIPLWVTWLVAEFVLRQLSRFGQPWVRVAAARLDDNAPAVSQWLLQPWFQNLLGVLITLAGLYLLGFTVSRVVGRRLVETFERLLDRLPVVQTVYGSVKQLISSLQSKPDGVERVVLIDFPSPEMKAVGFVTRTFVDQTTQEELAAVYVPTTPNPTSGYLEIVPVSRLVPTDWSVDQAMNFIMSGGAVAPDVIRFHTGPGPAPG